MEIESVLNEIRRNLHCICGRKRNTAEAFAACMSDYYHQGEICLCQLFSESSMFNNVSSSHHTTSQLNPRTHSAGIGTTVTWTPLLENSHALISANVGSRERTADVVNSSTQTMIPESEGEQEEDDDEHNLTAVYEELSGYIAGMRVTAFCLSIKLHKYESAKSTCLERKEHCCICLDDFCDGEELGKIDCGHVYQCWLHQRVDHARELLPRLQEGSVGPFTPSSV